MTVHCSINFVEHKFSNYIIFLIDRTLVDSSTKKPKTRECMDIK